MVAIAVVECIREQPNRDVVFRVLVNEYALSHVSDIIALVFKL